MGKNKYCRRCGVEFKSRQAYIQHVKSKHESFAGALSKSQSLDSRAGEILRRKGRG